MSFGKSERRLQQIIPVFFFAFSFFCFPCGLISLQGNEPI